MKFIAVLSGNKNEYHNFVDKQAYDPDECQYIYFDSPIKFDDIPMHEYEIIGTFSKLLNKDDLYDSAKHIYEETKLGNWPRKKDWVEVKASPKSILEDVKKGIEILHQTPKKPIHFKVADTKINYGRALGEGYLIPDDDLSFKQRLKDSVLGFLFAGTIDEGFVEFFLVKEDQLLAFVAIGGCHTIESFLNSTLPDHPFKRVS